MKTRAIRKGLRVTAILSAQIQLAGALTTAVALESVKVVGIGATTCSDFIREVEARPETERDFFAWAQGYMSGALMRAPSGVDVGLDLAPPAFPLSKQADFLKSFCAQRHDSDFTDAVHLLYRTLKAPPG